uniref:Uncharacterized protein n=1 Tax=Romanomermis culicivorax TaxID=13658 RepID=A0A915IQJ5_ROMCU
MGGSVEGVPITEDNNGTHSRWVHVQTSGSNLSSFFIATSIALLCFLGSTPNFAIAAAVVKNRNSVRFRKNHFFVIVAFHSLFRGVYLLFYSLGSVLYAMASLGWTWTAMRPWACWTFVVNGVLFAEYYNGFTILTLALDRHMSVSVPVKYAHLPPR